MFEIRRLLKGGAEESFEKMKAVWLRDNMVHLLHVGWSPEKTLQWRLVESWAKYHPNDRQLLIDGLKNESNQIAAYCLLALKHYPDFDPMCVPSCVFNRDGTITVIIADLAEEESFSGFVTTQCELARKYLPNKSIPSNSGPATFHDLFVKFEDCGDSHGFTFKDGVEFMGWVMEVATDSIKIMWAPSPFYGQSRGTDEWSPPDQWVKFTEIDLSSLSFWDDDKKCWMLFNFGDVKPLHKKPWWKIW